MTVGTMARPRWARRTAAILLVLSGIALAQAPSTPQPPMTNGDVVKMAKLGFGNEVIEAKIEQAPAVDFKLEVDDLAKLKSAGVSQNVISAMLKRAANPTASATTGPPPGWQRPAVGPNGVPVFSDIGMVRLLTKDPDGIDLRAVGGSMSTTFAYVTTLMHANFPGEKADARIQQKRPTLLVKSSNSPKGHFYLVSAEVDHHNNVRSVKMGNSHLFGAKNLGAPDSDNQVAYDVEAEGPDTWRLTPTKDLRPGEYGLWRSMQELYDFGVDP